MKTNEMSELSIDKIKMGLENGDIVISAPYRKTKNSQIYAVCKRLRFKTGERIPHYLFCSKCSSVLNINLSTHYRLLTNHYEACTGISVKSDKKGTTIFNQ